jgi:hypothetical protein
MKRGDFIRKQNYDPVLGSGYPVVKIKEIDQQKINGKHCNSRKTYVVISREEAIAIMEMFNSIAISSTPVEDKEFVCKRDDNGQPKEPISAFHIKKVLFHYKMINPDFDAYKCPKCLQYHLGKKKLE